MNAAPTPIEISVNMLRWRVLIEVHPRMKKGAPAQSTIGAASASCTQGETPGDIGCSPSNSVPIVRASSGTARPAATHQRRVKSTSSGLVASSSEGSSGSSAIPQIGQVPGPSCRICGCIGHVHIAPGAAPVRARGAPARYLGGSDLNFARHPALQK